MSAQHDPTLLDALRAGVSGAVIGPGDAGYDQERGTFNVGFSQHPGAIVVADSTADVQAAVRVAAERGIGVAVRSTGHGGHKPCDGDLLISLGTLRGVEVFPDRQTARVQAATPWREVLAAAHQHGLAPLVGSTDAVSAAGFLLGGGIALLSRLHGWAAESIVGAELVTADGELRTVDADSDPELLWGLRGSAGNLGVVTALEVRLFPHPEVYGGALMFPVDRAREVLVAFDAWADGEIPDETGAAFALMQLPPELAPPPFPDGRFLAVFVAHAGPADAAEKVIAPLRELGPVIDTLATLPSTAMHTITNDPTDPMPILEHGRLFDRLTPDGVDALLGAVGPDSGSTLAIVAFRLLGGQIQRGSTADSPLAHPDARYLALGLGVVFDPALADLIESQISGMFRALSAYDHGPSIPNFHGAGQDAEGVRAAYHPDSWSRLLALKNKLDPANLFRYNHNIR